MENAASTSSVAASGKKPQPITSISTVLHQSTAKLSDTF